MRFASKRVQIIGPIPLMLMITSCIDGGLIMSKKSASLDTSPSVSSTGSDVSPEIEIHSITPDTGSTLGGTQITISGRNFRQSTVVLLDGAPCAAYDYVNSREITCTTKPRAQAGTVDIEVRNLRSELDGLTGKITAKLAQAFTFYSTEAPIVLNAAAGAGTSKSSGGQFTLQASIGEPGVVSTGNARGEATSTSVVLKAGSLAR